MTQSSTFMGVVYILSGYTLYIERSLCLWYVCFTMRSVLMMPQSGLCSTATAPTAFRAFVFICTELSRRACAFASGSTERSLHIYPQRTNACASKRLPPPVLHCASLAIQCKCVCAHVYTRIVQIWPRACAVCL